MSNGPVPARLVLLQDLNSLEIGSKVRFLGCIQQYDIPNGILILHHTLSGAASGTEGSIITAVARVDITLLAETLSGADTEPGAWINVIGYLRTQQRSRRRRGDNRRSGGGGSSKSHEGRVDVQALMLWNAGALDVGAYERAVKARQEMAAIDRQAMADQQHQQHQQHGDE